MQKQPYDIIAVLGGGLYKTADRFLPTEYRHRDEFGMLGGGMRIEAAVVLYTSGKTKHVLFSTGVSEKQRAIHGPLVPPESHVYAGVFLERLRTIRPAKPLPPIFLEDTSINTFSNLVEILTMLKAHNWAKTAIVSSDYHVPRIAALLTLIQQDRLDLQRAVDVLSAERVVQEAYPHKYDELIAAAYASEAAQLRRQNEQQGLQDIRAGQYVSTEFQNHPRSTAK